MFGIDIHCSQEVMVSMGMAFKFCPFFPLFFAGNVVLLIYRTEPQAEFQQKSVDNISPINQDNLARQQSGSSPIFF